MQSLIDNEINSKSIITNIINKTCPNIILLFGDYGTGKTEFAKEIARIITCENPSMNGYCGKCKNCLSSKDITENTFLTSISLTNMTMIDYEKTINLIKENVNVKHFGNKVYIYDEFQTLSLNLQEMWLSETSRLDNVYLILTTTELSKIDKGILSRSLKIKMNNLTLKDIPNLLKMYNLDNIEPELIPLIYEIYGGSPREIINISRYCINSGLDIESKRELIQHSKKIDISNLLNMINNQDEYFNLLCMYMNTYEMADIIKVTERYIWKLLSLTDEDFRKQDISNLIDKKNFINLLINLNSQPKIAFILLYSSINFNINGKGKEKISNNIFTNKGDNLNLVKTDRKLW